MKKLCIALVLALIVWPASQAQTVTELEAALPEYASIFELLEGQATEIEVQFTDGSRSLGYRHEGGDLALIHQAASGELELSISPADGEVRVNGGGEKASARLGDGAGTPSLAWAALQAKGLATSPEKGRGAELVWRGSQLRYGSPGEKTPDADWPRRSWREHFVAVKSLSLVYEDLRVDVQRFVVEKARLGVESPDYKAVLRDLGGREIGEVKWFSGSRVIAWSLPGITEGWADEQRAEKAFGFEPTMEWAAVQAFAFWRNAPTYQRHGLEKSGTDDGCTGLHRLDNTILRPCCDRHDLCYVKYGCTYKSWFFIEGWKCTKCNITVVFCFVTAGGVGGGGGDGGGGNDGGGGGGDGCGPTYPDECGGDPCSTSGGSWCPPECDQCDTSPPGF